MPYRLALCWFCGKNSAAPQASVNVPLRRGTRWSLEEIAEPVPRCARCARFHHWFLGLSSKKAWLVPPFAYLVAASCFLAVKDQDAVLPLVFLLLAAALSWTVCTYIDERFPSRLRALRAKLEYPPLKAKLAEGWAIPTQVGAQAPAQPSFSQLVEGLLEVYSRNPDGYIPDMFCRDAEEIREIGEVLHKRGGLALMQAAHQEFAARNFLAKRNLEHLWDFVGQWRG
jgi:hypothetical protein